MLSRSCHHSTCRRRGGRNPLRWPSRRRLRVRRLRGRARGRQRDGAGVNVVRSVDRRRQRPRAVAIGVFDGVHRGHQRVLEAVVGPGLTPTVDHVRPASARRARLRRRAALHARSPPRAVRRGRGRGDARRSSSTHELQQLEPEEFAETCLGGIGAEVVVAGEDFRFGHRRRGDLALLEEHRASESRVSVVEGASSTAIRDLLHEGDVRAQPDPRPAARGRRHRRRRRRARRHARLSHREPRVEPQLLVPAIGIYAGAALGTAARRSRSARTPTTAASSGGSRRICSTSRATSTDSGSSSSCGSGSGTSARSRARRRSLSRSCRDVEATRAATRPAGARVGDDL